MICYGDMTFCGYYKNCKKKDKCHRCLTKKVEEHANSIELPICQFSEKPKCHDPIPNYGRPQNFGI